MPGLVRTQRHQRPVASFPYRDRLVTHARFVALVICATSAFLALYARHAPAPTGGLAGTYLISIAGYYGIAWIGIGLLLAPASVAHGTRWIVPCAAWIWFVYLAIDVGTFNLYRFHVDWMLIDMLVFDFRGVGLPIFPAVLAISFFGMTLALVLAGYRIASRPASRRARLPIAVAALVVPAFLFNSVAHTWASRYDREEVLQFTPYFPVYLPVRNQRNAPRISAWWPTLFPPERGEVLFDGVPRGLAHYPDDSFSTFPCRPDAPLPSILFLTLESWQADSLNPEVMPHVTRLAESGARFERHLASGTATVPGVFGLLYGLHASYIEPFRAVTTSNRSVFTETLHRLGYRQRVFTTNNFDRFGVRSLIFSRVAADDYYDERTDRAVLDHYFATLDAPDAAPRFDFVFLSSSHASYHYPPEFERFTPVPVVEAGYAINKMADAEPYKNDYHNSLYYLDTLVHEVVSELDRRGRLEDTWVVITGDHAEEFNENGLGYWGHGSNFTRWQAQTPLVILGPGVTGGFVETRLSLHQDIVPSLMRHALGCAAPFETYSNGADLFALSERRGTVLASYYAKAYVIDGVVLDRTTRRRYGFESMRDDATGTIDRDAIRVLMDEETRFLRRR